MRYEEMLEQVQTRAGLASDAEAEAALNGTLAVLGERVGGEAAVSVASQLPEQLATFLRREAEDTEEASIEFGADEFVTRVGARGDDISADLTKVVIATLGVIGEATGGALDGIRKSLPADYEPLFRDVQGPPGSL